MWQILKDYGLHLAAAAVTAGAAWALVKAAASQGADAGGVGLCCAGSLATGAVWEVGSMALKVMDHVAAEPDAPIQAAAQAVWQQAKWLLPAVGGVALVAAAAPPAAPPLACVAVQLLPACLALRFPTRHLPRWLQALLAAPSVAAAVADSPPLKGQQVEFLERLRRLQLVRQYPPQPKDDDGEPGDDPLP